jgi:hypothetical protein
MEDRGTGAVMDDEVTRVDIYILTGKGHYPVAFVKLPAVVVADLPALLQQAQQLDRSATYDAVIRAIWRLGIRQLRRNLDRHARLSAWDRGEGLPR